MKRIIVNGIKKSFFVSNRINPSFLFRLLSFSSNHEKRKYDILRGITFEVNDHEIVGIIGVNGAGKSTLLRIISGIYNPDSGKIFTNGKIISLINLNAGLQDRLTVKQNIFLLSSLLGLNNRDIKASFDSIIEFAGLKEYVDKKVFMLSDGMKQKLVFSLVLSCDPEILLLDELLIVGDEKFRIKLVKRIFDLVKTGSSIIIASHDSFLLNQFCNRLIWIKDGKIFKSGKTKEILKEYLECFKK